MKRGTIQHNLAILSITFLLFVFSCVPFHVFAEDSTYFISGSNEWIYPYSYLYDRTYRYYAFKTNKDVRTVIFVNGSSDSRIWFVNTSSFNVERGQTNVGNSLIDPSAPGSGIQTDQSSSYVYNGITYYVVSANISNSSSYSNKTFYYNTITVNNTTASGSRENAIRYTFGDLSVDPGPQGPEYGDLVDVRFTTNFTNSQQYDFTQMRYNKDTIYWDRFEDSNGNALNDPNLRVEIQAYMTEYEGLSKIDLLDNTILDMVNVGQPVTLYKGSAHIGEKSFTWQQVAEAFTGQSQMLTFFQKLVPHVYDNSWITNGWIYRIRLTTVDESYSSEWQIVYNVTSSPPSDAETIYNYYYYYGGQGIDPGVVNSIQNIQYINQDSNNVTSNYYVNGIEIPTSGSNWLETLLKFISDTIGKILDFLGSLFDGFIDLLLGLFEGFDPVGSFFNWWESLKDQFNGIDLTLPEYNLPEEDISSLSNLPKKTLDIFINNGLGFIIFVPLIILILRLFL